jgi:uncharacterized membrane protein
MAAQPNLQAVRFELEVRIARPVAEVFAYVSEVTNLPDWQESAVEAEWIEPPFRFRERRSFLGRTAELQLEVTAYEQDRRFDVKALLGPVCFEIGHEFSPAGGGTLLQVTAEAATGGAMRFAAALAKKQAERQFRSDLERLKDVLEGSDPSSSPDEARRGKPL